MIRSLRWRLLLGASAAILVALTVAWLFMTLLFDRHLERQVRSQLIREGDQLVAALTIDPAGALTVTRPLSDPRFVRPASGFYWQVSTGRQTLRSRSLWDQALSPSPATPADSWRLTRGKGPFEPSAFTLDRVVGLGANSMPVTVLLTEDSAESTSAQVEFGRELALFLAALWLFLSLAAWLQVHLGLAPLRAIRGDVAALRARPDARLADAQLAEVQPLIEALNGLADDRERDLRKARGRASDLAHGLKTPLAALTAQVRRLAEGDAAGVTGGLERSIAAIRTTIETELARSRLAAAIPGEQAVARDVAERLLGVLEQTERGETIAFSNLTPEGLITPLGGDDLSELLGALLENAARFARRQVAVDGGGDAAEVWLSIDDDGPGIDEDQAREAFVRGARLDQSGRGQGLGLAIAFDFAEASQGVLSLSRSALGGLRAEVRWPTSTR
jgi:signal transduction histidine kinase